MALFLGEEVTTICDDETEITGAGAVDARPVDLVHYAMAQREPDPVARREGGADAALRAGRPSR